MPDLNKNDMSAAIRGAVEKYFKSEKTKYHPFDKHNVARATYVVETKFGHVEVFFFAYKDMLILQFMIPLKAGEEERAKVGEFLLRANYGLKIGGFDFDFEDGEISYRVPIYCGVDEFLPPTHEQIDAALSIGLMMVDRYGDALVKVMFGLAEPDDAVAAAEEDEIA